MIQMRAASCWLQSTRAMKKEQKVKLKLIASQEQVGDQDKPDEGQERCAPDTNHGMDPHGQAEQDGRQISTHCPKDDLIGPVLRYMLSLLFVMSFLKEMEELIMDSVTYSDQQ